MQQQMSFLDSLSGKTYPEPFPATAETISKRSSKRSAPSVSQTFQFLDLRGGVWQPAGCVLGDGYSLAWRVYDAQYWGVPQRRKRIYLIADFRSERAGEILFEQDGVSGDSEPSKAPWQRTAGDAEGSAGGSSGDRLNVIKDREGNGHGGKGLMSDANTAYTVQTNCEQSLVYESGAFYGNAGSTRPIDFIGGGTPPVKHSSTVHVVMKKSTV